MSNNDVVKSVSRKLKYYFQVKRLEDGFDLSTADCPKLDHPPLRCRPTLMYDGLHDRPLKHYYSPTEIRAVLTQFKTKKGGDEGPLKRQIERYMKQYSFVHTTLGEPYYVQDKRGGRKLRSDMVGYGVILPKRRLPHKGSYPVLRTVPNSYATRGEAKRLLNNASRLLNATRSVELNKDKEKEEEAPKKKKRPKSSGAPRSFESHRSRSVSTSSSGSASHRSSSRESTGGGHNIYTYDPQGNKVYLRTEGKNKGQRDSDRGEDNDSTYGTNASSPSPDRGGYVTIDGEPADDGKVPPWLKKEMKKKEKDDDDAYVRPRSAPHPPPGKKKSQRVQSANPRRKTRPADKNNTNNSSSSTTSSRASSRGRRIKSAGSSSRGSSASSRGNSKKPAVEVEVHSDRSDRSDAKVQTGGELLRDYDPMERVLWDGETCHYQLEVFTGSRLGAGTRAPVKVALCGDRGRSEDVWLRRPVNHHLAFQKGQHDIFEIDTFYVGPLRKIQIGHDSQEVAHAWFVSRFIVKDLDNKWKYDIPCEKWFSSQHDAGQTIRILQVNTTSAFQESKHDEAEESVPREAEIVIVRSDACAAPEVEYEEDEEEEVRDTNTSTRTLVSVEYDNGRRDSSSSSSVSSTTSSSSRSTVTEEKSKPPVAAVPPKSPLPKRRDDFFDQRVQDKDYSSVIESLSHVSGENDRSDDFPADTKRDDEHQQRQGAPLELRPASGRDDDDDDDNDDDGTTARLTINDVDSTPDRSTSRMGHTEEARLHMEKEEEKEEDPTEVLLRGPSIHSCAKNGDLETLKKWVAHNPELKTQKNEKGESILHVAASHGQMEVVQWLSIHLTDLDAETPTGYTAIHQAAMAGHTNIMMVLSAMGARNGTKSTDEQTPLHLAALSGHFECVKWLVANRASLTARDISGRTAYDLAVAYDNTEVADFLKTCMQEQEDPHSSFHRMRFRSNRDDVKIVSASDRPDRKKKSDSTHSQSDKADPDSDKESWKNDSRPTSAKSPRSSRPSSSSKSTRSSSSRRTSSSSGSSSGSSTTSRDSSPDSQTKKHDEELMEKRRLYEQQHQKMEDQHVSFLDSIRNEVDEGKESPRMRNADLI